MLVMSPFSDSTNDGRKVGIHFDDIYGNVWKVVDSGKEEIKPDKPESKEQVNKSNSIDNTNIWQGFFFEEDSLFGSDDTKSLSSSSEDDDVSIPTEEDDEIEDKAEEAKEVSIDEKQAIIEEESRDDELVMNQDEIDLLLDLANTKPKISTTLTKQLNKLTSKN